MWSRSVRYRIGAPEKKSLKTLSVNLERRCWCEMCRETVPEIGGGTCTTLILSCLYCPLYCSVLSEICRMNGKSNLPVISVFAVRLVVGSREWSLREYWMTQVTCSGLMRRLRPVYSHYERRRRAYDIRSTSLGVVANWRTAWATKRGATYRMCTRLHHGKSHALGEFK